MPGAVEGTPPGDGEPALARNARSGGPEARAGEPLVSALPVVRERSVRDAAASASGTPGARIPGWPQHPGAVASTPMLARPDAGAAAGPFSAGGSCPACPAAAAWPEWAPPEWSEWSAAEPCSPAPTSPQRSAQAPATAGPNTSAAVRRIATLGSLARSLMTNIVTRRRPPAFRPRQRCRGVAVVSRMVSTEPRTPGSQATPAPRRRTRTGRVEWLLDLREAADDHVPLPVFDPTATATALRRGRHLLPDGFHRVGQVGEHRLPAATPPGGRMRVERVQRLLDGRGRRKTARRGRARLRSKRDRCGATAGSAPSPGCSPSGWGFPAPRQRRFPGAR